MMLAKALASASASAAKVYVEDVFSTYLYTGNGSTQTITNGIDLSGEGGLVWIKGRSGATNHRLFDTAQGATNFLESNTTNAQQSSAASLTSFNSSGFSIGASSPINTSSSTYASWTFRKAEKFFDVTTATQTTGNTGWLTFNHNLGSVPGAILIKVTNNTDNWFVYHRSTSSQTLFLNLTNAAAATVVCQNVTSTSFEFNLANYGSGSGSTYVAYLFAHDAGGFGDAGTDSVVKCGSFTHNASSDQEIDLGWEAQWVMLKSTDSTIGWYMVDTMRGAPVGGNASFVTANSSSAESTGQLVYPTAKGFAVRSGAFLGGSTHIYIAIRRGPMKTPTVGTEVFKAITRTGNGTDTTVSGVGFTPDFVHTGYRPSGEARTVFDRLRGANRPLKITSGAEITSTDTLMRWDMNGVSVGIDQLYASINQNSAGYAYHFFRRAPGFFDVVAYTGNGTASFGQIVQHGLTVAPELIIAKARSAGSDWLVWQKDQDQSYFQTAKLNSTDQYQMQAGPIWGEPFLPVNMTATSFTVGGTGGVFAALNRSAVTYISYLFATCPGVSKVGSYTGTGTTQQINCGFTAGARFVLIKRTDSTGDWYVWDTARGIVSGNDSYLLLNSTAAEVTNTDYIDPLSSGFQISSTAPAAINASGGSFIFLAVA